MHGILTPVCTHYRIQTVNRAPGRTSGIFRACQAIKPMSSPASVPHSRRATPCVTNAERSLPCRKEDFLMRCCTRDGGLLALRSRPAGGGFKPPHAALAEDRRGEQ